MVRLAAIKKRDAVATLVLAFASIVAVEAVVVKARRDGSDPARCASLAPIANRCCAEGQALENGRCTGRPTRCPAPLVAMESGCAAKPARVVIAGGVLRAGVGDWEAEGRVEQKEATVRTFELDAFEITESAYSECVEGGGCRVVPRTGEPGRSMGGLERADVEAYCAFRAGRLPTSDEWTFAAAGARARRYPWGDTGAVCRRGAWGLAEGPCGFGFSGSELAGAHPDGATPEGVYDLAGNVAEWVSVDAISGAATSGAASLTVGAVRGGSFVSSLATDLRTWQLRRLPLDAHSPDLGGRCAFDVPPEKGGSANP